MTQSAITPEMARHWIPTVFEPVRANFIRLGGTYRELQARLQLPCVRLMQRAVSYGAAKECVFFEYNDDPEVDKFCDADDWMKVTRSTPRPTWSSPSSVQSFPR